ncbi:MAG: hypothetical protein AAB276_04445 [Pseudomonadota bacterium]
MTITAEFNVCQPDDPACGTGNTYAIATAILKEVGGAPLTPQEQQIVNMLNAAPC